MILFLFDSSTYLLIHHPLNLTFNPQVASTTDDNCKAEFSHAVRRRGTPNMIPVVMEESMKATSSWAGPVGMRLGDVLYVRAWQDDLSSTVDQLVTEILARFPGTKTTSSSQRPSTASSTGPDSAKKQGKKKKSCALQ